MPPLHPQDRASLCRFTFADGRRCRSPRVSASPDFCHFHAKKEARSRATQQLSTDLSWFFSGNYLSANDLNTALAHVFIAVARGDVQPRAARTLAYLAQTMFQTLHFAQAEFIAACGKSQWLNSLSNSIDQNHQHRYPSDPSPTPPSAPTSPSIANAGAPTPASPISPANPSQPASPAESPDTSNTASSASAPAVPATTSTTPQPIAQSPNATPPRESNPHPNPNGHTTRDAGPGASPNHPSSPAANPSALDTANPCRINTSNPPRNC
jgi:hypothetical protein